MSVTMQNVLAKISLVPTHVRILTNKILIYLRFFFLRFNLSENQMNPLNSDA